ncbi:FG-GAP repeat domain-containing protein [Streptomyces sp. NPDC052236]|uniref:FG-GAP repeat domain-containing protein n=1 Tax=Streptomyces sp. NPDC052236 TaxID=3365686 RepID=UPI0037CE52B7
MTALVRRNLARITALLACLLLWQLTQPPAASQTQRDRLAQRFSFSSHLVSPAHRATDRTLRPVAPAYRDIRPWISSVGAGVALLAADGGSVSHDICLVDPRTDTVTIGPAPGTGRRYAPFALSPPARDMPTYAAPMGCLPADLNEDGWQDVVVYYWGRSPVIFMRRADSAPGTKAFLARELVRPRAVWNTNAATLGDYDGDGHLDLVFGNYFPDGARVLDPTARQPQLVMNRSLSNAHNGGANRLLRFTGARQGPAPDVRFTEVPDAFDARATRGWTLALGTQDLDGDNRPELYVANDFGPDQLLVNQSSPGRIRFREAVGQRHLTTPKSKVLGRDSFKGMGVAFTQLGPDRVPDILVSNIGEAYALHESNFAFVATGSPKTAGQSLHRAVAPYNDKSEPLGLSRSGWSWDVKAADFDNDGSPEIMHATGFVAGQTNRWAQLQETAMSNDLILDNPRLWPHFPEGTDLSGHDQNTFFVRGPGGRFTDVADETGVGTDAVSRAFAVGDVDSDGRLDFVVANQWAPSVMFRNTGPADDVLGLRLRLPAGGQPCGDSGSGAGRTRPAIGATATLTLPDGSVRTEQVYPANGHNGVNAPEITFGLGGQKATSGALPVRLTWRDGCARIHTRSTTLRPGWHELVLTEEAR